METIGSQNETNPDKGERGLFERTAAWKRELAELTKGPVMTALIVGVCIMLLVHLLQVLTIVVVIAVLCSVGLLAARRDRYPELYDRVFNAKDRTAAGARRRFR